MNNGSYSVMNRITKGERYIHTRDSRERERERESEKRRDNRMMGRIKKQTI